MNETGQLKESWAYDAGLTIEKGSIVLGRVESSLGCHDLRQPYFHKSAVLIIDHDDEFTRGIILNRRSNLILKDGDMVHLDEEGNRDVNEGSNNTWPMRYGGDMSGLFDENPEVVCLHSVATELGKKVSDEILPNVLMTSHSGACTLIDAAEATCESFHTFYGFSGWEPGQLKKEVERGSWYMVEANSNTIWDELKRTASETSDPRGAGLSTWKTLIEKICKGDELGSDEESFSDLMLKEWATEMLFINKDDDNDTLGDVDIYRALDAAQGDTVGVGNVVRGSSLEVSPFLLFDQLLHQSTVLIFQDTEAASVGLILNLPTPDSFLLKMPDGKTIEFPIRCGGQSGVGDEAPLIWLHCSMALKGMRIGKPLDKDVEGIVWTCTVDQVKQAIYLGYASPEEFMLVQGFTVWEKQEGAGGVSGQLLSGNFEEVMPDELDRIWSLLLSQTKLSEDNLDKNLRKAKVAWRLGAKGDEEIKKPDDLLVPTSSNSTTFDQILNDPGGKRRLVYGSSVSASELADDALRNWVKIFLLGDAEYASF
jgi:putative transcriptional regulator